MKHTRRDPTSADVPKHLDAFIQLSTRPDIDAGQLIRINRMQTVIWQESHLRDLEWQSVFYGVRSRAARSADWTLLNRMLDQFVSSYGVGARKFWDSNMGPDFTYTRCRMMRKTDRLRASNQPNGPTPDTWVGTIPHCWRGSMPLAGDCVVYSLFNTDSVQVYIGSTDDFRGRLREHLRDKPDVTSWTALLCDTRTAAYDLEDELLKALTELPRYNNRRGR
jgi:hypothetical protein